MSTRTNVFILAALLGSVSSWSLASGGGEINFIDSFEGTGNVPQFVPIEDQGAVAEQLLQVDVDTDEPANQGGLDWSLVSAPTGMSINPNTGVISWTPSVAQLGISSVTVRVEDLANLSNTTMFNVEVVDPSAVPLIEPIGDQVVLVGALFQVLVIADDPDVGDVLNYTLDSGPPGLGIDAMSGLMSWMPGPGDVGMSTVTVRATDDSGQFDTESFDLTVVLDNQAPVLDPIADRGAAPGVELIEQPSATDPDDTQLSWSLGLRPTGMSIDPDTGEIRWTPGTQQLGPHDVTVIVSDPLGFSDSAMFEVFVDQNRPPVAVDDAGYEVERGDTLMVPASGVLANDTDPNDDPLTTQLATGPQQGTLSLNPDGGFEYTPNNPAGTVGFDLKWEWQIGGGGSSTQPLVANLDDDAQAEVVLFKSFSTPKQGIVAFDGETGETEWSRVFQARDLRGSRGAIGDIDLDGYPELIFAGAEPDVLPPSPALLYAFEHHGGLKWVSESMPERYFDTSTDTARSRGDGSLGGAVSLADLDQDGIPEILVAPDGGGVSGPIRYQVWDAEGRKLDFVELENSPPVSSSAYTRVEVVDLDLDGDPEIVVGTAAFSHKGELLWSRTDDVTMRFPSEFPVVANLDDDPFPELIRRRGNPSGTNPLRGNIQAWNHDGSDLWEVSRDYGQIEAPITVADVDADGLVDVLVAGNSSDDLFQVLNGADGSVKWSQAVPTDRVGATAFDIDRDGFSEVVFIDNTGVVHVWDGRDGTVKTTFQLVDGSNVTPRVATLPLFADVDADGQAEFIAPVGGSFGTGSALRVFESPNDDWGPMRSLWNQQRYHVTNVNDDLTIPSHQLPHWLQPGLNQAMINQRLPEARVEEMDFFEYRAFDGEFLSNVARVDITVLPPNAAPRILSSPKLLASPGFEYVYPVLAVDGDPGEILTYAIAEGPAGMTVDSLGILRWTPTGGDVGEHVVVVRATDTIGASATQHFLLEVTAPVVVPDLSGRTEAQAVSDLAAVSLVASPILDTFSDVVAVGEVANQDPIAGMMAAAGADVRIEVSLGPVPVNVPDVLGLTEDTAVGEIAAAGLIVGAVTFANDPTIPSGAVVSQDPAPRSSAPPGSPVDLVISGGARAVIEVTPTVIQAGDTAMVDVIIAGPDGTPLDPQPTVTLALEIEPGAVMGTPPMLGGSTISTFADSVGEFRVSASYSAPDPEQISVPAVIAQPISDGAGADVFSQFVEQLKTYGELIDQLIVAVEIGDTTTIETVDQALGDLESEIDLARLRVLTPLAAEGGVMPDPATLVGAGFPEGPDDAAWVDAGIDLVTVLEQVEQVVIDGTAPDAVLNALTQDLADAAAGATQLDPTLYGVLDGEEVVVALLGTRAPRLIVADIRAVRQALRDAGIIMADGSAVAGRFTLPSLMSATRIRRNIIRDVYVPYLGEVARALGTVIGAQLLQAYTNGGAVVGIVTGASQSIHVFEIPNSVIEGFGFDTVLPEANSVTMVGPDLIDAVLDIVNQQLPQADDLKDLNSMMDAIQGQIDLANGVVNAFDDANSSPDSTLRGCILDNHPACRQLIYPDGFASVYTSDGGLSLPAPVAIIVRNLTGGGIGVFLANFVPTEED